MSADARCPSCGGLVTEDADWCGQCYAPLRRDGSARAEAAGAPQADARPASPVESGPQAAADDRRASVATPGGGTLEVAAGTASWECPVCGERNPLAANVCSVCRTPFARLFEKETPRPEIEPASAALWSLLWSGIGHWKAGFRAEGVARAVLLAWTLGTVLVILVSRSPGAGFGKVFPLFALYLCATLAIYVLSAADAARLADGRAPLVPSRTLLWASAGLVLLSVVLATFVTLPAVRG